jgi:hypothetical protein
MTTAYTVVWKTSVIEVTVASLVADAIEQGEGIGPIRHAMSEIDRLLATRPQFVGESRGPYERILIVPPLVVTYEIHEEERVVYVLTVHRPPARPGG